MKKVGFLTFCVFLFFSGGVLGEQEGVLNRLLAPGPLIGGHKFLEGSDCLKCHDAGKGVPDSKCLDCHKELKTLVLEKHGFHGMTGQSCIQCHADHKGRDFNSIKINPKEFDHFKSTGYRLEGKHADLKCVDCHTEKRKDKFLLPHETRYFGKISTCLSCHKKDDVHFFKGRYSAKDCNTCHGLKSWKENLKFNHERDAKFKLEGHHAELRCQECHLVDKKFKTYRYQWDFLKSKQCLTCHDDFHKDKLGPRFRNGQCLVCHGQKSWAMGEFDHAVTKYPLKFKHAEARCIDCHKQKEVRPDPAKRWSLSETKKFNWTGIKTNCLECHDNFHKFGHIQSAKWGNLNQCLTCHEESGWKKTHDFSHNQGTRYALDGKHLELKCADCHLPAGLKNPTKLKSKDVGIYHWQNLDSKTCESCHANPHIGQFKQEILEKKCTTCHTTESWSLMKTGKGFDHTKTRFPLTDAHTSVACSSCHMVNGKQVFKFSSFDQKFCMDCHQNIHSNQFSKKISTQNCTTCHTVKTFKERLPFDHNLTNHPLNGAHRELKCEECHVPSDRAFILQSPNINEQARKEKKPFFMSRFQFPDLKAKACLACHQDFHKGQLGSDCLKCHNESTWKKVKFDHNTQSHFLLRDKHLEADCTKCHVPVKNELVVFKNQKRGLIRYKPLGQNCVDCHKDAHKGAFGNQCQECHVPRGWKATKDFHKNFTLTGVHYMLECAECHRDGRKLAGLSQQCLSCHQKDDIHNGTLPNCKECHRQQFWEVSGFKHSMSRFPLRGAHRTLDCQECHYRSGIPAMYQGLSPLCQSCHLADFTAASSVPEHSSAGAAVSCENCHRQQFSWIGKK